MKKISLIAVYNNQRLLDEMLATARKQQNVEIDYVMIDNRENRFSSAAAALNYGAAKAVGDVLVFLHQDIEFLSETALENIYDYAAENTNVIFGAAGVKMRGEPGYKDGLFSSMYGGPYKVKYNHANQPTECFTLDECLIACWRDCMDEVAFDEDVCDGWHLYGADLCLQAGLKVGMKVMVVPMDDVWHKSNGNADASYLKTQNRLSKKYRGKYPIINTTNGFQYTGAIKGMLVNLYRKFKY